jgi:hypothetical protein
MEFDDGFMPGSFAASPRETPHARDYELADAVIRIIVEASGVSVREPEREAIAETLHRVRTARENELRRHLKALGGANERLRYQLIQLGQAHNREIARHHRKIADCDRLKQILIAETGWILPALNAELKRHTASVASREPEPRA